MSLTQSLRTITMKWIACYAFPYSTINRNFRSIDRLLLQMNLACRRITSTAYPNDRDNWPSMTCALDFLIQLGIRLSWSESTHTHWRTNALEDRTHNSIEINDIATGNRNSKIGKTGKTIGMNRADTTAKEKDHTLPNLHHRIGDQDGNNNNNGKVGMEDIAKPIQRLLKALGKSKPIQRFFCMLVEDVTITDTTGFILLWTLHVAWSMGALYLPEFMYNVNHELVCSYSVSHFLELCLLIAALVGLTFLSVILYSRTYTSCRSFLVKSMLQSKENLCLFVSCFYSFGEPLKTWTYAMLTCIVYHVILLYSWTSQTCVHDNVWLKT